MTSDICGLVAIVENDPLGLLNEPPRKFSGKKTEAQRLVDSFAEIVEFVDEHGRLPTRSKEDIIEFALACRLEGILANSDKLATIRNDERFADHPLLTTIDQLATLAE